MKKLSITLCTLLLLGCAYSKDNALDILTLFSSKSTSQNKVWVGTFQLAFNDMKNFIIKKDVIFEKEKPTKELKALNKEEFNSSMLNDSTYYTSYGETSPEAKEKIAKDLDEKFKTKSDILDSGDWSRGLGKYYAYAMLKKNFEFLNPFDKLEAKSFNNSKEKYEFFGIDNKSNEALNDNLAVLFHNKKEYAIRLYTKNDDIVYLYKTNSNKDFKSIYKNLDKQSKNYKGDRFFNSKDTLAVPNLKIKDKRSYDELCNKIIKGTNIYFSQALETIELSLNNEGGSVKSEAMLMTKMAMIPISKKTQPRNFNFDETFVLFLIDKNKKDPYLALRINDLKGLQ